MRRGETIWTPELIARLTADWNAGIRTPLIGKRLGLTKNAVIGKANRLKLTPRTQPPWDLQPAIAPTLGK